MQRVLLVLLIWLLSSSAAYAGCAWVLWMTPYSVESRGNPDDPDAYDLLGAKSVKLVSAWESKKECEGALKQHIKEMPKRTGAPVRDGALILVDLVTGGMMAFQCLPESVKAEEGGGFLRKLK